LINYSIIHIVINNLSFRLVKTVTKLGTLSFPQILNNLILIECTIKPLVRTLPRLCPGE
jgi:hypothetical protein